MVARHVTLKSLRGEAQRYRSPENEREAAILAAATKLFGARGYAGTRTADVAAAAGITERTLFRYFPTKDSLYRRVMFPALLAVAAPQALLDAGALFASDAESYGDWHRRILKLRVAAAREAAAQFRLLIAGLMTDEALRRKVIGIWKENVLKPLVTTLEGFQERGELRADVPAERIARGILSLNLGYIFARALLAPEAKWDDETEIAATVELMLHGAAKG